MSIKKFTTLAFFSLLGASSFAQQGTYGCSVGLEDGALIKERMMENRRNYTAAQIEALMNDRAITYIPVKFTIVGDNNGAGYADIDNIFAMLCDMNNDYRTQDVQFYMRDVSNSVRYSNNTTVYNDGAGFAASSWFTSNKISNCINIYTSASVNNQVASYYSPFGDYVFVLNQMANGSSSTGSHEVGHFFSLNHTFYGWENTNFNDGTAPSSVNGDPVEKEARSGGNANCATAADGFCDTEADYISFRDNCPYNRNGRDPLGVAINPNETLIMSYFADQCVDSFSQEQKGAMAADINSRGWSNLAAPTPNAVVSGAGMTAVSPAAGATFALNGDVTLTWNAVPNATGYVVVIDRTLFGSPIPPNKKVVVYGTNSVTIPASFFGYPHQYTWKVKPFNQYQTCGAYSSGFSFNTLAPTTGVEDVFASSAELAILSNPVGAYTAEVLVTVPTATTASMMLYAMDGRQIMNQHNVQLQAGDNVELVDVSTLNNGVYVLVVTTPEGSLQQKLVIQR